MTPPQLNEMGDITLCVEYFKTQKLPVSAKVLDIGTRFGSFVNALYEIGYQNVYGIDNNIESIKTGINTYPNISKNIQYYSSDIIPFPSNTFSVITMFDVLEHIPQIQNYLAEVYRILQPGGKIIFQTPNKYINIPWEILKHHSLTKWKEYHCSLQSRSSLRHLLITSGFSQIIIQQYKLYSVFKYQEVKNNIGSIGPLLFKMAQYMPLSLYPNFWGSAKKPIQ